MDNLEEKIIDYFKFWNLKIMKRFYEKIPDKKATISINHISEYPELFLYAYKTRVNLSNDELFDNINDNKITYENIAKQTFDEKDPEFSDKFLKEMDQLIGKGHIYLNGEKIVSYCLGEQFIGNYKKIDNPCEHLFDKVDEINLTLESNEEKDLKFYEISNERHVTKTGPSHAFFRIPSKEIFLLEGMNEFIVKAAYHSSDEEMKKLISNFDSEEDFSNHLRQNAILHEIGEYGLTRKHFYGDIIDDTILNFTEDISQKQLEEIESTPYSEFLASMFQFKEADKNDKVRLAYLVWFNVKYNSDSIKSYTKKNYNNFMDSLNKKGNVFEQAKKNLQKFI